MTRMFCIGHFSRKTSFICVFYVKKDIKKIICEKLKDQSNFYMCFIEKEIILTKKHSVYIYSNEATAELMLLLMKGVNSSL